MSVQDSSTTTMVERVARAIYDAAGKEDYVSDYRFHGGDTCLDGHFSLDALARAAIEAMERPTEEMLAAAIYWRGSDYLDRDQAEGIFSAMISAALAEK